MDKLRSIFYLCFITGLFLVIFSRCSENTPPSIYDPDQQSKPNPEITSLDPPNSTLAGFGEITINGMNFSPVIEENTVFFGNEKAIILSSSATEIKIQSPNLPEDSIEVKIAVHGALLFSNSIYYTLVSLLEEVGDFDNYDDAYGIAFDKDDNLYVSLAGKKIVKVTPDGEKQDYATTLFDKASAMKVGPGGALYLVNIIQFMLRVPPGGGASELFTTLPGGVFDLDFDSFGNIYCGGSGNAIYRVKSDGSNEVAADYPSVFIRSLRVYDGYVYVGGKDNATDHQYIWRNQIISADELGSTEIYFDWSNEIDPASEVLSITFAADGDMYVGTNAPEAIIIVHPNGSHEALYPGVLEPESYALCWGNGQHLYTNRRNADASKKRIIKINVQKDGAPYHGRQ